MDLVGLAAVLGVPVALVTALAAVFASRSPLRTLERLAALDEKLPVDSAARRDVRLLQDATASSLLVARGTIQRLESGRVVVRRRVPSFDLPMILVGAGSPGLLVGTIVAGVTGPDRWAGLVVTLIAFAVILTGAIWFVVAVIVGGHRTRAAQHPVA